MCAKQAKIKQTDWTKGGRDISNTAIPLYQTNLRRMDEYLTDPTARMNDYIDKYYNSNTAYNQDFLRQYNRAMAQKTASNYAATGGGYTTSGQRAYDDSQRYYNDLASRLRDYGVQSSRAMADADFNNMRAANADYNNAYALGAPYSNIEQRNDLIDKQNKNWYSSALSGLGNAAMAIAPFTGPAMPFVFAGGALASGAGAATKLDTSNALNGIASIYGGSAPSYQTSNDTFTNFGNQLAQYDWSKIFKNGSGSTNTQGSSGATGSLMNALNGYLGGSGSASLPSTIF